MRAGGERGLLMLLQGKDTSFIFHFGLILLANSIRRRRCRHRSRDGGAQL